MSVFQQVELSKLVERIVKWDPGKEAPNNTINYIDISSINRDSKQIAEVTRVTGNEAPSRARQLVETDDVLVSTVRPNLNAVAQVPEELDGATASTGYCVLRPKNGRLNSRYLFHWVRTPVFIDNMVLQATGASYPAVTDKIVKASKIPLPPLTEQQRIAAILDKADALRAKRRAALAKLDTLLQSTFLDMFGDPITNPKGWQFHFLSKYFSQEKEGTKCGPFGSALKKDEYVDNGIPVLAMDNIQDMQFIPAGRLFITPQKYQQLISYSASTGDIIISRAGTVGKMCVVETNSPDSIISTNLIRLSLNSDYLDPYFFVSLMTFCKGRVGRLKTGEDGAYSFMNTGVLKQLKIPVPPIRLQKRYLHALHKIRLERQQQMVFLERLDSLFHSLQQRAFKGEL